MKQDYLQIKVLEVASDVFVSGQLFDQDIRLAAKQGVRSIINNRPDGEAIGQPLSADLEKVADEFGITFVHFPIKHGPIEREAVENFAGVCEDLKRPLLIFCRTGGRSTRLWELSESV